MMRRKILISYADDSMSFSLKRIAFMARRIGVFDQVHLYTPSSLPSYIKDSPLLKYKRGGGYWAWKPAIIWEELQINNDGDIIVYVDAGSTLKRTMEWELYFNEMETHDTLLFQYKDHVPNWKQFGQTSSKIRFWTKQKTLDYFQCLLGDTNYGDKYNKIGGGAIILSGKHNVFIKHWLDITLQHPELIMDPPPDRVKWNKRILI